MQDKYNQITQMKTLFDNKQYKECIEVSESFIRSEPQSPDGHRFKGLSLHSIGRHEDALPCFKAAIRLASPRIDGLVWRRAVKSLKASKKTPDQIRIFWDECNSKIEQLFDSSRLNLMRGRVAEAIYELDNLIGGIISREDFVKLTQCIEFLGGARDAGVGLDKVDVEAVAKSITHRKIILISGMGWSGSGAITDYLAEFEGVAAVTGEAPFIARGEVSLRTINKCLNDKSVLRKQLVNFFYFNIIGFGKIRSGATLKAFASARSRWIDRKKNNHFDYAVSYCKIAKCILNENDINKRKEIFDKYMVEFVVHKLVIPGSVPEGGVVLLDNDVPIGHVAACDFLRNATFFCCFRDPRSNYVAFLRENPMYHGDVSSFIERRGALLNKFNGAINNAGKAERGGCTIRKVQFEEFVLSECYRDNIAESLGLNLAKRKKHSRFKPWISMRNVILHQEHEDQGEIKLIEESLRKYCYEPCVCPLLDAH